MTVRWINYLFTNYIIQLNQHKPEIAGPIVYRKFLFLIAFYKTGKDTEISHFDWTVSVNATDASSFSLDLSASQTFYFWLSDPNNNTNPYNFTSCYFNITSPSSLSPTSSTVANTLSLTSVQTWSPSAFLTPTVTTTTQKTGGSEKSQGQAKEMGLGVGLGVGIPIFILLAICTGFAIKYLRKIMKDKSRVTWGTHIVNRVGVELPDNVRKHELPVGYGQ
ncbi:uncharacterized protein BDR25DRAFT_363566 [Lindgomyces ingoldianus]|uniref:Uncharacterized protein n=1 Tax=Lindgomyces ingoldianus TaxID=673940 RepID=A0ACB6Q7A2_9PLEO|nr:uncharacterized protein BDR25DRAFT_363566 [Lindgomyces ingoldianus]KAF2462724.1 hypothetical protein BDR25DRAFT_363566 [Lindgomyces ingoldianus]